MKAPDHGAIDLFEPLRPELTRVAYGMLGSVADAEDVVQDAFLRWLGVDRGSVRKPQPFLKQTVTRLCLDRMKSVRRGRETYVGSWLPEPVVETDAEAIDDVTLPLLLALERLSPLERAAFLLHDVFGLSFDEISSTIGRGAAACRQLATRARDHVRAERPRYSVPRAHAMEIAVAFFAASRDGDLERLRSLLASDVTLHADGGGKVPARKAPATGIEDVMRAFAGFVSIYAKNRSRLLRYGFVNGLPGFVTVERGDVLQTTALELEAGRIAAVYVVRNPDKLRHVAETVH